MSNKHSRHRIQRTALAVALAWAPAGALYAGSIDLGDGAEAVWSLNASFTSGWRTKKPDSDLIGPGDGGTGSAYTGSADKNFGKGASFTQLARIVGDVDLKFGRYGAVVRAKAWNNLRLTSKGVPLGSPANDYSPGSRLDDSAFDSEQSKFKGAVLLDAYGYASFDLSDESQLKLRLGQHAVNFGESMFVPGVNQYQALDINALRVPGTLLKEAILPVPQLSANLGLGNGFSAEGFYQFRWRRSSIDGCGTFWSPATALNCTDDATLVANDTVFGPMSSNAYWNGTAGANFRFSLLDDKRPKDSGQFGFALKKTVESLDTELGAYYVNYTTRVPNLSGVRDLTTEPSGASR